MDADLTTKALATVKERNHGGLKSLVTRFLQLYVNNPAQVFYVIASLEVDCSTPVRGEPTKTVNAFDAILNNVAKKRNHP